MIDALDRQHQLTPGKDDKSKAPEIKSWADLCDPKYKGKTSMRLRRTILLGTAYAMGEDPFAAYADLGKYQAILDKVVDKLIACKEIVKAYWQGGDSALEAAAMRHAGLVVHYGGAASIASLRSRAAPHAGASSAACASPRSRSSPRATPGV